MGSRPHPVVNERERRIVDVLMTLQPGEVTTYGDVAEVAGHPRQARLVGRILATTQGDVPWWRVVNAAGKLVAHQVRLQAELLAAEGVTVAGGRVVDAPSGRFSRRIQPGGSADGSVDGAC
jgi:methylated-DNA-protein-cysteine methyltransferase related protein